MPSDVATLCFHTIDAEVVNEGSFAFSVPGKQLRTKAVKVYLASCEFPMVQQTIETSWNRLYYGESICLRHGENYLHLVTTDSTSTVAYQVSLPPRLNRARVARAGKGPSRRTVLTTDHPHFLFGTSGAGPLLCSPRVLLHGDGAGVAVEEAAYESELSFSVPAGTLEDGGETEVYVYCPLATSPFALARALSESAGAEGAPVVFAYDGPTDRIVATVLEFGNRDRRKPSLSFSPPTALSRYCGLSDIACVAGGAVPSEAGRWFDFTEVECGFHSPCHRPMCTGQPFRFPSEVEMSLNRFYFPVLPARGSEGNDADTPPGHIIVFSCPNGIMHTCVLPAGKYDAHRLCEHLEVEMTSRAESTAKDVQYRVEEVREAGERGAASRFRFSCFRSRGERLVPAIFSLAFNHPLGVDPRRFGFLPLLFSGRAAYESSFSFVYAPRVSNLIRMSDNAATKKFTLHATPVPPFFLVVAGSDGDVVVFRSVHGGAPFSSGARVGDVLPICSARLRRGKDDENEGEEGDVAGEIDANGVLCDCVVVGQDGLPFASNAPSYSFDPTVIRVLVPAAMRAHFSKEGSVFRAIPPVEPWNAHFGKPRSVPPAMVGWPKGALLWGVHGQGGGGFPPYLAPYPHNLDHPDYVCITFSEDGGSSLEHTYDGTTRPIFCKLSLYPLFKEERMLPRDTTLLQQDVGRFTISFWNPDMNTPYNFHGTQFSFSLAFVSATP